jgi:hypothetical protein
VYKAVHGFWGATESAGGRASTAPASRTQSVTLPGSDKSTPKRSTALDTTNLQRNNRTGTSRRPGRALRGPALCLCPLSARRPCIPLWGHRKGHNEMCTAWPGGMCSSGPLWPGGREVGGRVCPHTAWRCKRLKPAFSRLGPRATNEDTPKALMIYISYLTGWRVLGLPR